MSLYMHMIIVLLAIIDTDVICKIDYYEQFVTSFEEVFISDIIQSYQIS